MKQTKTWFYPILLIVSIVTIKTSMAQIPYTPPVIDSTQKIFCNASAEMAIRTSSNTALFRSLPPTIPSGSYIICGNGKFRIIFKDIINGTGTGFDDATLGTTRRNCVCDVINYIESVISVSSAIGTTDPTIDIIFNLSTNTSSGNLASAAPIYDPSFYVTTPTITPGYYGGYLFDYITTGVKPDVNSEEAQVTVDFGPSYAYCTSTIGNCEYDFFSVILHELTHGMGFLSFAIDNSGTLSSRFANNVFSKLDQYYLYYNNGTTFNKMFDISLYSANNGVNPALPTNAAVTNRVWLNNSTLANKQNQPVYSQGSYGAGTSLSHFDSNYMRGSVSPGYSSNYLMDSYITTHQFKRTFTIQELNVLQTMGYTIKSPFITNINNRTPYHAGNLLTATSGGPSSYMNSTPASGLTDLTISTTHGNNVTINLSTGIVSNGSASHSLNFVDPDSDPVTVYEPQPGWKGVYNIRGCGSGGNNTNQLTVNSTRDIITFTPRNNFIGRAQFAFHLYDGKQRGDYVVFTIDVAKGSSFANTPSNELLINGDFEEGTEMREIGGNEFNLVADEMSSEYNYNNKKAFSDGVQYINWGWNDPFTRNSSNTCLFPGPFCFDNCAGSGITGPLPVSNAGNRYNEFYAVPGGFNESFNMTLAEPILSCNYTLEADVNIASMFSNITSTSTLNFLFHNQGINGNVSVGGGTTLFNANTLITSANINTWTHISIPFTYTSSTGSNFVQIDAHDLGGQIFLDNLSLIRTGSAPSLTFTPSTPTVCAGQTTTISVSGATNYTWSTGATTSSISVSPSVTTVYTVTGASGCGTTVSQVTLTVMPTPTLTIAPGSQTICPGATATLTASGANTYTWSTGDFGSTAFVTPTLSTTYSVVGTNTLSGCTATQTAIVYTWSLPTGTLTPSGSISLCGTQTIALTAISSQTNTTYSWTYNGSAAGTGTNINVSNPGQYVVTITNTITGCIATYTTPVYVAPTLVCDQCLVPNGDFEYAANLSNTMFNITDAPFWNSPTTDGSPDYYNSAMTTLSGVSVPNNVFASGTPDHTGNVNQAYAGLINYATNVSEAREYIQTPLNCALEPNQKYNVSLWARAANGSRHISNNVGIHFSNTAINGTGNLYSLTPQFNFTSLVPATAWTQLTGTLTGSSAAFITIGNFYNDAATSFSVINAPSVFQNAYYFIDDVSVTPAPPSFTASTSSCITSGSAATLTLNGSPGYYITNGVTTQTLNAASGTVAVNPTVTTTYTITPKLNCVKCNIFSVVTISVTPVIIASNATICASSSTTLTASGATTYTWNTGANTSTISVAPSSTTVYSVSGSSGGCTSLTKTISVTVNPNPTVTAVANPTSICVGQTATLTAGGATTYSWSTTSTNTVINVTPGTTTTYTVRGFYATGCSSTKTVTVLVGPVNPVISVNSSSFSICGTNAATLIASGAAHYTWTPGAVLNASVAVTPTTATVYTVSSSYGAGCGVATATVLVSPTSSLCCAAASVTIGTSLTSSVSAVAGSYAVTGTVIDVQGVVTFTGNTSYTGYTFRMAPYSLLRVDPTKTLTLINCKLFSCSELWNGILLREDDINFGNLVLTNTTIEDMYNGIVVDYDNYSINSSTPSGSITITGSVLNKNYISVQMRNSPGMSAGTGNYPFSMVTSTISSATSGTSPGAVLKPSSVYTYAYNNITNGSMGSSAPYLNFPRAFTGLQLSNLGYLCPVVVGNRNSSSFTNLFSNMDFGVNATEVYTRVYNNHFKGINGSVKSTDPSHLPPAPVPGPDEIGIAVVVTQTTIANFNTCYVGANSTLPSGGNPFPDGNIFEDCNKGVKATNNRYVTVIGNVFTTTTTSIPVTTASGSPPMPVINPNTYYPYQGQQGVWCTALGTSANLNYNYIRNYSTGIYNSHTIYSSANGTVNIIANDIAAPSSTGYCLQAIQADQAGGINIQTDKAYIYNNRLENVYRGVVSNAVKSGLLIKANTITVEGTAKTLNYSATSQRTGVVLNSCEYASIKGNSLTQTGSPPTTTATAQYINGTYLTNSKFGKVECNTATALGRCFVFQGTSDNNWLVNNMSGSYTGLEIRTLGRIGTQGAASGSSGNPNLSANTWATITQETNIISSPNNNTNSPLYLLSGAGTQPTLNFGTPTHSYLTGLGNGIRVVTGTSYTCNSGSAQRTSGGGNAGNGNVKRTTGTEDSLTNYISLAQSDENTYDAFTDEFIYQNKQAVYQLLDEDSIEVANGSTLDDFYQANQNTAIAQLTEVQQAIANDDINSANSANASVSPSNEVEYKHQRANELALKYLADRFYVYSDAEKQDLYTYANECIVKGYYVVQARNIINIISNLIMEYTDDCEAEANAQRKSKATTNAISNNMSFVILPNPNNGEMTLVYDLVYYKMADVELLDVTGKLVRKYTLETTVGNLSINEQNLHNGVYFYRILAGRTLLKTDKIVIIK
ncbi:MAG: T9SS type A sorting domain-containing protein [Bacteroidota bacterium]